MTKREIIKFSIIVPIYNVELYLRECLESILTQDFNDFEVICVNDASTDRSLEILQEYAENNNKIKMINNSINKGLSFSRNCGIRNASGKYILFVDSDDMMCKGALRELSKEADQVEADIIYFNMAVKVEGLWAKEKGDHSQKNYQYNGIFTGQELFVNTYQNSQMIVEVYRQLYLKSFIEKHQLFFYEGILHEDTLFSIICAMKAERVSYLNRELYIYRKRDGSIMSRKTAERMKSYFIVFIELWKFWQNNIFPVEVNRVFSGYLKKLHKEIICMKCYFPEVDTITFGGPAEQFMFSLMIEDTSPYFTYAHLSDDQLKCVRLAKKVIIYGAGKVGIEMIRYLKLNNIKVDTVAVSNKEINPDSVLGVEIEQIDQLVDLEHAVIIVAVTRKYQKGVVDMLKKTGVLKNAIFMDNQNS